MNDKDAGCLDWIFKMMFMAFVVWSFASIENRLRDIYWSVQRIEQRVNR